MKKTHLYSIGIGCILVLSVAILLMLTLKSNQAMMPVTIGVSFQGEYKIADGEWKPIVKGEKISSINGDVTLRGHFKKELGESNLSNSVEKGEELALYFNHIGGEVLVNGESIRVFDAENPRIGVSACGKQWIVYENTAEDTDNLEIVLKNPHKFGNYNAVNDFLNSIYMYSGTFFDKYIDEKSNVGSVMGFLFIVVALAVIGVAIFSFLIRLKESKNILIIGMMMLFAGAYFVLDRVYPKVWGASTVFSTSALVLSMMLYILSMMCMTAGCLKDKTKKVGEITTAVFGICIGAMLIAVLTGAAKLYDLNPYWTAVCAVSGAILIGCCIVNMKNAGRNRILIMSVCIFALFAMLADIFGTAVGFWQGGMISKGVFAVLFVIGLVIVIKIIPSNYRAATEKEKMEAELQRSQVAIMLSQIQPHFLYNSINAIRELCRIDPPKARDALGDFAEYLRGNMDSINSREPIHFSKELAHIKNYLNLEKMRFGDELNIIYEINESDFFLPSLSVQPLVENAVKHGVCEKENGGTVLLRTRKEDNCIIIEVIDDGIGFDMEAANASKDGRSHLGIQNTKKRLQHMSNASLSITSVPGKGTRAEIRIGIK